MAQVFLDVFYSFGNCLNCFPGSPTLKINSRSFKILRLLGEGGFSYVYLVQDTSSAELFALKKIHCPFGAESVAQAMKEVDAYKLFARSPGIIHSIDYSIATDRNTGGGGIGGDPSSKTVYVLLPYYRRGNLQDMINANLVNHATFPERRLLLLFLGVCRALRDMHHYDGAGAPAADGGGSSRERMEMPQPGGGGAEGSNNARGGEEGRGRKQKRGKARQETGADDEHETEQQLPLMHDDDAGDTAARAAGGVRSYAHRDIKPGNIMISDSGSDPILMDLGSIAESPIPITSRSLAIATQDTAAEHSTMPYRAPELFDVKTGAVIDCAVDIWSLGCTLYACLVGKSPFEMRSDETGGSLSLCVLGGDWRFPDEKPTGGTGGGGGPAGGRGKTKPTAGAEGGGAAAGGAEGAGISEPIREIVRKCLALEPTERPDIDELIVMVEAAIEQLPEGDAS